MSISLTSEQLDKIADNIEEVTFVNTSKGRLVLFNPDLFLWNAYTKEDFDSEEITTRRQWEDFMIENDNYFYLEKEDFHQDTFDKYVKNLDNNEEEE